MKTITLNKSLKDITNLAQYIDEYATDMSLSDFDASGKRGWFIGSIAEIALKTKIEKIGKPLKDWDVKIYRGVLTGLNEAFIIDKAKRDELIATDPKSEEIIKPILRGRDIKRYSYDFAELYILATGYDVDIPTLYPAIYKHLLGFEEKAKKRDDQGKNWWNLRSCVYYNEFEKEKVVYGQFQDGSEFSFAPAGFYMSSNEYMLSGEYNKKYFLGLFNSRVTKYYLDTLSSSLGGNSSIFQKSVFIELPVPKIKKENQHIVLEIERIVDKILVAKKESKGDKINKDNKDNKDKDMDTSILEKEVDDLVYELYGLSEEEVKIIEESK